MDGPFERLAIRITRIAAFAIPLAMGVMCASTEPYWLDSPEFTAAAQVLGIPHPPGHPLWVMLVKPFTLLPIGTVAFRVSAACALFSAVACFLLYELCARLLERAAPSLAAWTRASISLVAALTAAVAPGWWFQAVRAEVYSLQILLVMAALYPLVTFCLDGGRRGHGRLYLAAFAFGLGLSNHHFIMFAALPAAIPPLVSRARELGGKGALVLTGKLSGVSALGLLPYLFLPLRSVAGAPVALGGVHSASDFLWVVTAKVYQKSMAREHAASLDDRSLDAVLSMMGEIGPVIVVSAAAGLYLLLRRPKTRLPGVVLALTAGVAILLRSIMGFDPFNPDYYGYMLPATAAMIVAAAAFGAIALNTIVEHLKPGKIISPVLALALLAIPALRAGDSLARSDLSGFRSTRLFYDMTVRGARPGTVFLASYYKLFFVLWSQRHIDGARPDATVINPQLFGYPGYLESTMEENPRMRSLAWSMVVNGKVTESAVSQLALDGPLRVEPSPWIEEKARLHLVPHGPAYTAAPEPMGLSDVRAAVGEHMEAWRDFYHLLGTEWREHETWRMLSWYHYLDALFLAERGAREGALEAVEMARVLGNVTPQILGLEEALKEGGSGRLDVTPYLPGAAGERAGEAPSEGSDE